MYRITRKCPVCKTHFKPKKGYTDFCPNCEKKGLTNRRDPHEIPAYSTQLGDTWKSRPFYAEYIRSYDWQLKSDAAKERSGNRCQVCYSEEFLETHHRTYMRLGHELDTDLTVLCRTCHAIFSKYGRKHDANDMRT